MNMMDKGVPKQTWNDKLNEWNIACIIIVVTCMTS